MKTTKIINETTQEELMNKTLAGIYETEAIFDETFLQSEPRKLLFCIMRSVSEDNAVITTVSDLCKIMHFSRHSVTKSINYLCENGWISTAKYGTSLIIVINPDPNTLPKTKPGIHNLRANILYYMEEDEIKQDKQTTNYKKIGKNAIFNMKRFEHDVFYNSLIYEKKSDSEQK